MLVNVRRIIAMAMIFISNAALAELLITDATVRLLPPSVPNTSAYFTLQNTGDKNLTLVGAQSGIANKAEDDQQIHFDAVVASPKKHSHH